MHASQSLLLLIFLASSAHAAQWKLCGDEAEAAIEIEDVEIVSRSFFVNIVLQCLFLEHSTPYSR